MSALNPAESTATSETHVQTIWNQQNESDAGQFVDAAKLADIRGIRLSVVGDPPMAMGQMGLLSRGKGKPKDDTYDYTEIHSRSRASQGGTSESHDASAYSSYRNSSQHAPQPVSDATLHYAASTVPTVNPSHPVMSLNMLNTYGVEDSISHEDYARFMETVSAITRYKPTAYARSASTRKRLPTTSSSNHTASVDLARKRQNSAPQADPPSPSLTIPHTEYAYPPFHSPLLILRDEPTQGSFFIPYEFDASSHVVHPPLDILPPCEDSTPSRASRSEEYVVQPEMPPSVSPEDSQATIIRGNCIVSLSPDVSNEPGPSTMHTGASTVAAPGDISTAGDTERRTLSHEDFRVLLERCGSSDEDALAQPKNIAKGVRGLDKVVSYTTRLLKDARDSYHKDADERGESLVEVEVFAGWLPAYNAMADLVKGLFNARHQETRRSMRMGRIAFALAYSVVDDYISNVTGCDLQRIRLLQPMPPPAIFPERTHALQQHAASLLNLLDEVLVEALQRYGRECGRATNAKRVGEYAEALRRGVDLLEEKTGFGGRRQGFESTLFARSRRAMTDWATNWAKKTDEQNGPI